MVPTTPDDETDSDFETRVRRESASRENIVDCENRESTAEDTLVRAVERTETGSSRHILYRLEHERRLEGKANIHWVDLGPIADNDSKSEMDESESES